MPVVDCFEGGGWLELEDELEEDEIEDVLEDELEDLPEASDAELEVFFSTVGGELADAFATLSFVELVVFDVS